MEKIDVAVPEGEIRARKMELPSHAQWMPCWDGELLNCWILKHEWLQLQGVSLCWCKPLSSMGRPPCWCWSWLRICRGAFSDDQVGQHGVYLWKQTKKSHHSWRKKDFLWNHLIKWWPPPPSTFYKDPIYLFFIHFFSEKSFDVKDWRFCFILVLLNVM